MRNPSSHHRALLVAFACATCAALVAGSVSIASGASPVSEVSSSSGAVPELDNPSATGFEDRDNGFYLGLRIATSFLRLKYLENDNFRVRKAGAGLELLAGYSFNRIFSLQLDLAALAHETSDPNVRATFAAVQLFAHYRPFPARPVRPYVKGGVGAYGFGLENAGNRVTTTGPGIPIGGGVDYFFNRHFSLGLDVTHNIVEYDRAEFELGGVTTGFEIDEDGDQTSVALAFRFYF